jgi:hypothetical protein
MHGPAKTALRIAGVVVAVAVGSYTGVQLIIPLVATALIWWVGEKLLPQPNQFLPAAAVQAGQGLWMILGLFVVDAIGRNLIDVLLVLVGVTWLLAKPGLLPLILLTAYQAVALLVNGVAFVDAEVGTTPHKALLIHVIWRLLALVLMWQAHVKSKAIATD